MFLDKIEAYCAVFAGRWFWKMGALEIYMLPPSGGTRFSFFLEHGINGGNVGRRRTVYSQGSCAQGFVSVILKI